MNMILDFELDFACEIAGGNSHRGGVISNGLTMGMFRIIYCKGLRVHKWLRLKIINKQNQDDFTLFSRNWGKGFSTQATPTDSLLKTFLMFVLCTDLCRNRGSICCRPDPSTFQGHLDYTIQVLEPGLQHIGARFWSTSLRHNIVRKAYWPINFHFEIYTPSAVVLEVI